MIIDHVGIVVSSLEKALQEWTTVFGYQQRTEPVINSRQKVRVVFLALEKSVTVKLIEPTDRTSPIFQFAARGGGLHHLCFRCADVADETSKLREHGFRVLAAPQPGEAFEGHQIAFLHARPISLSFELIDTELKTHERYSYWKDIHESGKNDT